MPNSPKPLSLTISCTSLSADLLPFLLGEVFHVSDFHNYQSILKCGELRPNTENLYPTTCGSSLNSYFRLRGCISFFDFRALPQDESERFHRIYSCSPFPARSPRTQLVYFFPSQAAIERLIPWTRWQEEQAWEEMLVPYVEAGHSGPLSLSMIEHIMHVDIDCPPSPLEILIAGS